MREGIILAITFDKQWTGFAEIASLRVVRQVTMENYIQDLQRVFQKLAQRIVPDEFSRWETGFFNWLDAQPLIPENRFGLESALYNAVACKQRVSVSSLLSKSPLDTVSVNGLLQDTEPLDKEINVLLKKGFQAIKIKAGGNVEEDIKRIKKIVEVIPCRIKVHIDVNQRWGFEDALFFADAIDRARIEYIEEPFKDISRIPEFFQKTSIAVALDESILLSGWKNACSLKGVKVWVLKPTPLGGIRRAWFAAADAKKSGVRLVISSSFETGIGLSSLIHLAAACGSSVRAGIDTLKYFKKDLLKKPLAIKDGKLNVPIKTISLEDIHFEYLTEV